MSGIQIYEVQAAVSPIEEANYRGEAGWLQAIRANASHHLARKIMADASLHRRYEPDPRDKFPAVRHVWRIGIASDLSEVEAREADMKIARAEGRQQAARVLEGMKERMLPVEAGGCKWALISQLEDAINRIDRIND